MNPSLRQAPTWVLAAAVAALAGCAGTTQTGATPSDCAALAAKHAAAETDRQAAEARKEGAWKVVIPFAVAARHASASVAVRDADRQVRELEAAARERGCAPLAAAPQARAEGATP